MRSTLLIFAVLICRPTTLQAEQQVDYAKQIRPLLATKCFACHGALKQESGLRLDAASLIRQGGDSGAALLAGRADQSLLIEKVSAEDADQRMPPTGEGEPLTAEQLELLRTWIDQGAVAPEEPIPSDARQHWAYQPPSRPRIPTVMNRAWAGNEVDAFLAAQQEAAGLTPAPPAAQEVVLRRVYLDLLGLPPTREQRRAFLADDSPRAYERLVDRLLNSPQYGERWGRHWMDVWRYSDWAGFGNEIRYSQRHIWRWRDWIVQSLNADKGYDRMILEMLAADELAPGDDDALRATGFLARNWYKFDRNSWLDDVIEHTGRSLLGATFKCARCHDHKYDPISQREYYRLRAIFEPYDVRTDRIPGQLDASQDGLARVYDAKPEAATFFFERGEPKRADTKHPLQPGVPTVLGGQFAVQPLSLPLPGYYPAMREFVARDMVAQAQASVQAANAEVAAAKAKLAASAADQERTAAHSKPDDAAPARRQAEQAAALAQKKLVAAQSRLAALEARIAAERQKHAGDPDSDHKQAWAKAAAQAERLAALAAADQARLQAEHELQRAREAAPPSADAKSKSAADAAAKKLAAAQKTFDDAQQASQQESTTYQPLGPTYPHTSTGRRLALARWVADRRNPLTARVAVNHIWLRHLGRPLVENVDDFGLRSPRPPLVDLLDYLAVELMENNWSMKHIHRLIVTSQAYRRCSKARLDTRGAESKSEERISTPPSQDPDNKLYWRMNPRRMEAETIRDAILYVAGNLDLTPGGPDIDHTLGFKAPRRSLYFRHARERQMEFLRMFDAANPRECYRRLESIRPQQALAMINSSLALAQSRRLAGQLMEGDKPAGDDDAFILAAFETVLSRAPLEAERKECRQFLQAQVRLLSDSAKLELLSNAANPVPAAADPAQRARENLVLVLFNHNEFVTIR